MTNHSQQHYKYLHNFLRKKNVIPVLHEKNLNIEDLLTVIVEPDYYNDHFCNNSMCDYLFGFKGGVWMPSEMKGSYNQIHKAEKQLKSGKHYIEDLFNYSPEYGLFVVYNDNKHYRHEWIDI